MNRGPWRLTSVPWTLLSLARHDPKVRFTRSEAERRLLRAIRRSGLPEPEVGHRIRDFGMQEVIATIRHHLERQSPDV